MKLKNKKTGEIIEKYPGRFVINSGEQIRQYDSLAELNEEWEDYEEPKDYYFIRSDSLTVGYSPISNTRSCRNRKEIGNYFETKEEAEKAVEKLKIYNKLKQNGFVFSGWYYSTEGQLDILADNHEFSETEPDDLTELFGDKIC